MGIYQLEPFNTIAGERSGHRGITVDYWRRYVAPRMGAQLEVVGPFPIKRIESMLENGMDLKNGVYEKYVRQYLKSGSVRP